LGFDLLTLYLYVTHTTGMPQLKITNYMVMSRDQNAGRSHNIKQITVPMKAWNNSDIWEQN